jgi:K(+)-stimulated pyrophosphate-energized sodium pump
MALAWISWTLALAGSILALILARKFYKEMMKADEGNERMVEIAQAVRDGADAYLWQQYKVVGIFFAVMFVFFCGLAFVLKVQSEWVPFAFLTGGFFSGFAGWCGMKTATWASSRTAAGAQKSLNQGLQVAFKSGAVMGLTVVGLGLLDITLWFFVLFFVLHLPLVTVTVTMLCFGMGASSQALFARVGGGIFTKAADVGADLVGKVEAGIPEDDPRNPATIADNVGDNVGDVAGMGADLYESYCGSILATAALGVAAFSSGVILQDIDFIKVDDTAAVKEAAIMSMQLKALFLPIVIAAFGIVASIVGIKLVKTEEQADQGTLLKALAKGVDSSSAIIAVIAFLISLYFFAGTPFQLVGFSVIVGLGAGWVIGKWTEYATSDEYGPTQNLAKQAETGPATVIIGGIADGMKSVWVPVIVVSVATLIAFAFGSGGNFTNVNYFAMGLYGVGIAAVGMLSTLGITLATDAYGPIADNAGGNAEMAGLDPEVRKRTDALDSLGNTTAATGKGFAIGSAALTALALLAAYVEEVRMGFDHWCEDKVAVIEQLEDFESGAFYKINGELVVQVKDKLDDEGNVIEGEYESYGFLAMPNDLRDPEVERVWDAYQAKDSIDPKKLVVTTQVEAYQDAIDSLTAEPAEVAEPEDEDGTAGPQGDNGDTGEPGDDEAADEPADDDAADLEAVIYTTTNDYGQEEVRFVGNHGILQPVENATMSVWMDFYSCSPMNPKVLVGMFLGAMATFVFCAMTMKAVGRAAFGMVEEVRRQFREIPGIMEGTGKPDYQTPVQLSTKAAQREMIIPSLLGLVTPIVVGMLLGVAGVMGLLVGTLTCGFCVAVFMSNAGGAWDNAKKYIEAGALGGKGTEAHKAAVVGDTVGDPFKDTSGPSLNILIKLMSMVSVVVAGLIVRYSLHALGIF